MSNDVELTYKRVGEHYEGEITASSITVAFSDWSFAKMMTEASLRLQLVDPHVGLVIKRTDRKGLLPARLEPQLLHLLRTDPVAYIKANSVPDRVLDLRDSTRKSKLAESDDHVVPKSVGLRHGLDTLADAFGEVLYAKAKPMAGGYWRYEHPATGRWSDLQTIEHWLSSHDTEVRPSSDTGGWLLIKVELLLKTHAERFYYPREWNEFGSWITKEQLQAKIEKFRKDKANVSR